MSQHKPKKCPICGHNMTLEYTEYPSRISDIEVLGGTIAIPPPSILPSSCAGGTNRAPIKEYWKCSHCGYSETDRHDFLER